MRPKGVPIGEVGLRWISPSEELAEWLDKERRRDRSRCLTEDTVDGYTPPWRDDD